MSTQENLLEMLDYLKSSAKVPFSVEVEKVGRGFEEFIPHADLVLVSKEVAQYNGCGDMKAACARFSLQLRTGARLVVAWGEAGAACWEAGTGTTVCPAHPPPGGVVDTLGAGDTFNAVVVGSLAAGRGLQDSVQLACRVAGAKVGFRGFDQLGGEAKELVNKTLGFTN